MIKCNLAAILAQRNIKITEVADIMKISRTTLTALVYNTGKGIQFDTMDKLCDFLDIGPGELFSYSELEISVIDGNEVSKNRHLLTMNVNLGGESHIIEAYFDYEASSADGELLDLDIEVDLPRKFFNKISMIPQKTIENELAAEFFNFIYELLDAGNYSLNITTSLNITDQ